MKLSIKSFFSALGYIFLVPYAILEPVFKIPDLIVMPGEPSYRVHVAAALFATIVHGLIIHLLFRGLKRPLPFGISLLVAVGANVVLDGIAILYVIVSL